MNRAGLLNFWYYDDEIFHLSDGKMLLRGTNGSGKSVTMQSFLPVLLDGKKTPDRLDPFGSKARKMEDYLLGEKGVVDRDERTGYLFLEYKKSDTKQYITTGIGMQAKRNKPLKTWYFIITDNRRIGYDFELAHEHQSERIPLSAKELENRISIGGHVVDTQREYMELVNKYIFGFQSLDAFEDLIKLLIQLRSPKLSKDFKPTVIYEILESALPPLTDDELRHLSDTIENMDQTQQQIQQLEREFNSTEKLVKQYHLYNQYVIGIRAQQWRDSLRKQQAFIQKVKESEDKEQYLMFEIKQLEGQKHTLQNENIILQGEKERLDQHEVWRIEKDKSEKLERIRKLITSIEDLQKKWDLKRKQLSDDRTKLDKYELELTSLKHDLASILEDLTYDAERAAFDRHDENENDFKRLQQDGFDFTVWKQEIRGHLGLLNELIELAKEEDTLKQQQITFIEQSSAKKQKVDEIKKELDHYGQWYTEEKQKLTDGVFKWIEEHAKLSFTDDHLQQITRFLEGLYDENRFEDVRNVLNEVVNNYILFIRSEIADVKANRELRNQELLEKKSELENWRKLKLANPERAEGTEVFRKQIVEEGKRFLPFYAAVEFQSHIAEEEKARIEAALKKTGILDSLIVDRDIKPIHDSVISPSPSILGYSLADYLQPDLDEDSPISASLVDEVLRSIPLEPSTNGFHIDIDGSYSIGCIIGHAPDEGQSKFIGRTSRRRFQQEKIKDCEEQITCINRDLAEIDLRLSHLNFSLEEIDHWKKEIPSDHSVSEIYHAIAKKEREHRQEQDFLLQIEQQLKEVTLKIQRVHLELHQKGNSLNLTLKSEKIDQAIQTAKDYQENLHELQRVFDKVKHNQELSSVLRHSIQEKEQEMDDVKGEQNSVQNDFDITKAEVQSIEEQLKLKGVEEVRKKIQDVIQRLSANEREFDAILENLPRQNSALEQCRVQLVNERIEADFWRSMSAEWEQLVKTEVTHQFVKIDEVNPEVILSQVVEVLEKYDFSKLSEQLTKAFINEQTSLTEYRMFEFTEDVAQPNWFSEIQSDYFNSFKTEWQQWKNRRMIQMEYKGQRVSPYYIYESLKKELNDQQLWLDEQDRQLYEDIIVNTVGVILRNRIQRASKWVREMDQLMASRDNSSGLIFSIAWKPKTAESEHELDTNDLVSLLQRNSKFLSEDDLDKITKHFQSRIAKAKEMIQLRNEGTTLHQVLKEVLDYRKWFSFVLSYRRENEAKRELTDRAFFRFSGGEKAMAMYIPLFTAAYSRYKEASEMAPYIISLDEAFAGVDEMNIRDMFEVVEQLNFDYIMNSQALWGDYDTVSNLAIYELVRPKNADFVTVIRYHWDGQKRSLVIDETEESVLQ